MRIRYSFSSRKTGHTDNIAKTRTPIPEMIKKVIEDSDIILEILDARFPEETRNKEIEEMIKAKNKRIIYILNKSDLIENIPGNLPRPFAFVSSKRRQGIRKLKLRLKIEAEKFRKQNKNKITSEILSKRLKKDRVNISIIGYPNTGKSSLINAITGRSSAAISQQSGYTKGIQKIRLMPGVMLLDTPGVIPENENSAIIKKDLIKHTKINVRTYDKVREPELVIGELMKAYPGVFQKFYKIETEDSEVLIEELGRRFKLLLKGNHVDIDRTARKILKDWQEGKIK